MSQAKILACSCDHAVQDQLYGSKRRVHNETAIKTGTTGQCKWRCTVCQTERSE